MSSLILLSQDRLKNMNWNYNSKRVYFYRMQFDSFLCTIKICKSWNAMTLISLENLHNCPVYKGKLWVFLSLLVNDWFIEIFQMLNDKILIHKTRSMYCLRFSSWSRRTQCAFSHFFPLCQKFLRQDVTFVIICLIELFNALLKLLVIHFSF